MQLMGDGIAVLGSRLGVMWDNPNRTSYLVRHGTFPGIPMNIKAGVLIDGEDEPITLPISQGRNFAFYEQESTPCTISTWGIDPHSGLDLKLKIITPFKPRDSAFSTTPALFFELSLTRKSLPFRHIPPREGLVCGKMFLEFESPEMSFEPFNDEGLGLGGIAVSYVSKSYKAEDEAFMQVLDKEISCRDLIAVKSGNVVSSRIEMPFRLEKGQHAESIKAAWCVYDEPVLIGKTGKRQPFKYTENYSNIFAVAKWALGNFDNVASSAKTVDGLILGHNLGVTVSRLLSYTLHSWLINTWWTIAEDRRDFFTVWEGICYFHSTIDVEFTQMPFYLSVWPELLSYELDIWPEYFKEGKTCKWIKSCDTLFMSHDMGRFSEATGQSYPHEMEIEESANYIIMSFAYWRRTGDDRLIKKYHDAIYKLMNFIVESDTTGNGIPDKGCANTIDDASPAIQYGSKQIYLGVKAMCAVKCGIEILKACGFSGDLERFRAFAKTALETLENECWMDDHYVVSLTKTMDGLVDPWTGQEMSGELEGWHSYHIYTPNTLAALYMVGFDSGLSVERLKTDMLSAFDKTIGMYGCRHTDYEGHADTNVEGLAVGTPKVGWVAMNMLRDIAAIYLGVNMTSNAERYWEYQLTTNTQRISMFFETFYGNNLHFYPRGLAVYGYLEACAGFVYDKAAGVQKIDPIDATVKVPLLYFADWEKGTAPIAKKTVLQ